MAQWFSYWGPPEGGRGAHEIGEKIKEMQIIEKKQPLIESKFLLIIIITRFNLIIVYSLSSNIINSNIS